MERADEAREPPKLREKAYDSFTRHLLESAVRPGQFISQRELVELTGLPLGAIRELVPRLEAEGLIKTVPQRGMQVAHIDLTLIRDAYQFRLFLEKEAMALFVEAASPDTIAALAEFCIDRATFIADGVERWLEGPCGWHTSLALGAAQ